MGSRPKKMVLQRYRALKDMAACQLPIRRQITTLRTRVAPAKTAVGPACNGCTSEDPSGQKVCPYQCSKAGCGRFYGCLYHLATHEERCSKKETNLSSTSYRFALNKAAEENHPPSIIIINRSSSHPPVNRQHSHWIAHHREERPRALCREEHHRRLPDLRCSTQLLQLLDSAAPGHTNRKSSFQENVHQRLSHHRAFKFTIAIVQDKQATNEVGVTPTLISIGLDG
jgi:hypothetical protein